MAHIRSLFFKGPLAEVESKTLESYQAGRSSEIIWNVTNKCNLLCKHCYVAATGLKKSRELSTSEALYLVDRMGALKVPLLFITGGEPFLRKDLYQILERAHRRGIRLVISTNATLIDDYVADRLKGFGVDYVAISLYGPREFHDDYVLVPGTFDKIMEAIERLRDRDIGVCIKTTVNAETYPHTRDTIELAKRLGARLVYPCDLITAGRAEKLAEQRITPGEWRELADYMLDEVLAGEDDGAGADAGDGGIEFDIGAQPSIAAYLAERLVERGYDIQKALDRLSVMSACPVGKGLLAINSEGNILACSFMQDFSIGNVRDMSLGEAVQKLFEIGETPVGGRCGSCRFTRICRGCRAKAYMQSQNLMAEDPLCMLAAQPTATPLARRASSASSSPRSKSQMRAGPAA